MKKHLIFAGGGHSHIHSLANLDKFTDSGVSVTVVNRSKYHYYSGMGPGLLSGYYDMDETRFNVKEITESSGCRFIQADVVKIIPEEKKIILSDNSELNYDIISFNTGSEVIPLPVSGVLKNLYPVKPVENISLIRERITGGGRKLKIAVAGGGAAGVEVASNLSEFVRKNKTDAGISIISRERLLAGYSESFYSHALRSLKKKSIIIYENRNIELINSDSILFTTGEEIKYDLAVNASGIRPSGLFSDSGMKTGADGGLEVNKYLQSAGYPEIFAGGDCISFEPVQLNKVGVYAVREGMMLYQNLLSYINGSELEEFKPQKSYLSILNMGFKKGIMLWKGFVLSGALPFYFKYYLDSKFMKKYQKHSVTLFRRQAMKFSVVIPVLNESDKINDLISHVREVFNGCNFEIIVSDGDEHGSTVNEIHDADVIKILSQKGRAVQMNRGAALSTGDILIFLHADTLLPIDAAEEIESAFTDSKITAGAFDHGFDVESAGMNLISFAAGHRSRLTRIPFGDQAIFIRSEYFKKIGGYKEIPLMEDVELMKRIRSRGDEIYISKLRVKTSARKWINEGMVKNTLRNWRNQILYTFGWNPEKLVKYYYKSNKILILLLILFLTGITSSADNTIHLGFNNLSEWEPLNFPKIKIHSRYSIIQEKEKNILQCESNASASGLIYKKTFNIYNYTKLKWKWKVSNVYNNADPLKKSGDDYPIRIYIIFKYNPDKASLFEKAKYNGAKLIYGEYPPHSSVNYVWSSKVISDRMITSPFTDRVKLILLEKGSEKVNTWITEEVNILEDYKKAFGENPPETASLAIMSDSDNTGESAKAFIEYIEVK